MQLIFLAAETTSQRPANVNGPCRGNPLRITLMECTSSATSVTTPLTSLPGTNGSFGFSWYVPCSGNVKGTVAMPAVVVAVRTLGPSVDGNTRLRQGIAAKPPASRRVAAT